MKKRYIDQMTKAYGLFTPGSAARDLRNENAQIGLATCHRCLKAFNPSDAVAVWYCSADCVWADSAKLARQHRVPRPRSEEVLRIDNRPCRGCAA